MNIVIFDGYIITAGELTWEGLNRFGRVTAYDRSTPEEVIERIKDADIAIVNKAFIGREAIDAAPRLKYISILATGYNTVDHGYAASKGIPVSNLPGYGTVPVSQFTFALLLEICHHAAHHSDMIHAGRWKSMADWCFWDYPLIGLSGKTMGVIGYGNIGKAVSRLASAFGMKVLANTPHPPLDRPDNVEFVSLDRLLSDSDVVSLHCPLTADNAKLINADTIARMKDGAILLNVSRGGLVDEPALARALRSGKLSAAGLDVVSTEPISGDNPLLDAPNCIITPHIAWANGESRKRIIDMTVENVDAFLSGAPINVVNGKNHR